MTTPKNPGPDQKPAGEEDNPELYDSIDELDNLISNKTTKVKNPDFGQSIPVLDDVIDPDDMDFDDDEFGDPDNVPENNPDDIPQNNLSPDQLEQIIGSVDEKLSRDLDELVHILKDAIKDNIITEIKSQLEAGIVNEQNPKPDGDTET